MGKKLIIKGADFSKNGIAPEYQILDWICSAHDNQQIDTGIARTNNNMKFEIIASMTDALLSTSDSRVRPIFGNGRGDAINRCGLFWLQSNKRIYYSYGTEYISASATNLWNDTDKHIISNGLDGILLDGDKIRDVAIPSSEPTEEYNIMLLGSNAAFSTGLTQSYVHVHEFKIWADYRNEDSLILDLIPVKKNDGTICMRDKVSGEYFYSTDGQNLAYGEIRP